MPATTEIKEHMEVIGSDGVHLGTVDHMMAGDRIKLTKSDSEDGMHHFISADLVDHVDDHVHLNISAADAMEQWEEGADGDDMELENDASEDETTVDEKDPMER